MKPPRQTAQRNEMTPWSTEGGRGMCGMCKTLNERSVAARACRSTTWSFDRAGLDGCDGKAVTTSSRHRERRRGIYPQAARSAVEMWIIEVWQIAPFSSLDLLRKDLTSPRFPFAPSTERK